MDLWPNSSLTFSSKYPKERGKRKKWVCVEALSVSGCVLRWSELFKRRFHEEKEWDAMASPNWWTLQREFCVLQAISIQVWVLSITFSVKSGGLLGFRDPCSLVQPVVWLINPFGKRKKKEMWKPDSDAPWIQNCTWDRHQANGLDRRKSASYLQLNLTDW